MKESPESDYYIGWSSVVEAPVWGSDRSGALAMRDVNEERLARADATGTSALYMETAGLLDKYPEEGSWADSGTIYMQRGLVSRANMFILTRRLLDGDEDVTDLLTPFDDEDEVRPA